MLGGKVCAVCDCEKGLAGSCCISRLRAAVFILFDECHSGVLINSLPWCSSAARNKRK